MSQVHFCLVVVLFQLWKAPDLLSLDIRYGWRLRRTPLHLILLQPLRLAVRIDRKSDPRIMSILPFGCRAFAL